MKYQFSQNQVTITVPLPLGGKSSEELRIPKAVTSPRISVPQLGVEIPSKEIKIPTFTIRPDFDLTLPLMGKMEVSAKVKSNYYNFGAMMSAGDNTEDSPSYMAKFNMQANSPIRLLSFSTDGNEIFMIFFK